MPSHENQSHNQEAEIVQCDVVIVGGGIAGIACAERLAREARRQGRQLRIVLIEQEEKVGSWTSAGLEGWYHAGGLYSNREDTRYMTHCLVALEDLYNWYFRDPAIKAKFHAHCNLKEINETCPRPKFDIPEVPSGQWFVGEISYILPLFETNADQLRQNSAGVRWSNLVSQRATAQAKVLVAELFYACDWRNKLLGWCQVPYIGTDAKVSADSFHSGRYGDIVHTSFKEILDLCLTKNPAHAEAMAEFDRRETELKDVLEAMKKSEQPHQPDLMLSRDVVMNTVQVISDLIAAAYDDGVRILTRHELIRDSVQVSRVTGNVRGIRVRNRENGRTMHIVAKQYVFALGFGFDEGEFLRRRLSVPMRVEKHLSVMVAASPGLCKHSFVRMGYADHEEFNHLYHPGPGTSIPEGYAIVADSNALPENADADACAEKAIALIDKEERIFPDHAPNTRLGWYGCSKTEFVSLEETERDYSYRLYPRVERFLVDPVWRAGRAQQKTTALEIQKLIIEVSNDSGLQDDLRQLSERIEGFAASKRSGATKTAASGDIRLDELARDGWALNKALHSALQLVAAKSESDASESERTAAATTFNLIRRLAIAAFGQQVAIRDTPRPNYLCVVPGKFSLFSSLAHNVYLEMECRGLYHQAPLLQEHTPASPEVESTDLPSKPEASGKRPEVAFSKAEQILKGIHGWD